MPQTVRSCSIEVAIRCLQVSMILLVIIYGYYFTKFTIKPSVSFPYPTNMKEIEKNTRQGIPLKKNPDTVSDWTETRIKCDNRTHERRIYQKMPYWVVENFVKGSHGNLDCSKTVTLTTIAEYPDLYHLVPLIQRWHAPISVALYCNRYDYKNCLDSLAFLRKCVIVESQRYFLNKYLSVHTFFEDNFIPKDVFKSLDEEEIVCGENPMYRPKHSSEEDPYRDNVARNIAKNAALTQYILSSDIDLVPSVHLISNFLRSIAKNGDRLEGAVFLLPVLEAEKDLELPRTKTELLHMLSNGSVVEQKRILCDECVRIPNIQEWMSQKEDSDFSEMYINSGKPIIWHRNYIGERDNPYFDEVGGDRQTDILLKSFTICTKNYFKMFVSNNAFLIRQSKVKTLDRLVRIGELGNVSGLPKISYFQKEINYQCILFYFMN